MSSAESALAKDMARFHEEFVRPPAKTRPHALIIGDTRSGKTNLMLWLIEHLIKERPNYTYFWFDLPKDSESLALSQFKPCRYIVPHGRDVKVELNNKTNLEPYDVEVVRMENKTDIFDPWKYLRAGYINIICIEPFILKAKYYGPIISRTFEKLIYRAVHDDIIIPLTGFIDEVNNVAPNRRNAYDKAHIEGSMDFMHNAERLAGHSIQLIGSTQFYTELLFPTRKALSGMQFIKRGALFPIYDEPRLWETPKHWQRLSPPQVVIRWKDHTYSESDIKIPLYPAGCEFGKITYVGEDIDEKYLKFKALRGELGELPCDTCGLPHEIRGPNLICSSFMRIFDIGKLKTIGCEWKEAKA